MGNVLLGKVRIFVSIFHVPKRPPQLMRHAVVVRARNYYTDRLEKPWETMALVTLELATTKRQAREAMGSHGFCNFRAGNYH